ncbi:MAG: MBL fold metallo-hydrolase [Armatimonadota bacterium]
MLTLRTITSFLLQTNCYLLMDEPTHEAILIDAPAGICDQVAYELEKHQAKLSHVILTHGHFDHTMDAPLLKQRFGADIWLHESDWLFASDPESQGIPFSYLDVEVESFKPDHTLQDSQIISIGNTDFQVIQTPGHTPGGICLYGASENRLFTGDTLFAGTWGRTDYAGGDDNMIVKSLRKLGSIAQSTQFFPGHGQSSTIGSERWLSSL